MLDIADRAGLDRRHAISSCAFPVLQGAAAQIRVLPPRLDCPGCRIFDPACRLANTPERGQVIDPAQQLEDDQRDHSDRDHEEDDASPVAIGTSL